MKYLNLLLALMMLSPMFFAEPTAAHQVIDEKAAIVAHGIKWSAMYEADEIDEMRDLYEDDAWLMTHGAPAARGVDAILAYLKKSKESTAKVTFDFEPEQIIIDGNRAFLISKYWMDITPPKGETLTQTGRSMLVFKRGSDNKWRIWRDIDNQPTDIAASDRPAKL